MKNFKEIIKIGLTLFAITAVSALLLALINNVTAPIIAENETEKTYATMGTLIPDADSFEKITLNGEKNIVEAYRALDSDANTIGCCVISTAYGYGGEIKVLTGIIDNKVCGVDILSHSETPGLGAKATEPEFKDRFLDKTVGIGIAKENAGDNEINAMSGATITSTAVTSCVNTALEFAMEVEK